MSTSVIPDERVKAVHVTNDTLSVDLFDGRTISVPLAWFPRLIQGTPRDRARWKVTGGGYGIHWPDLDEDLSVAGLLRGEAAAAPRPSRVKSRASARGGPARRRSTSRSKNI